MTKNKESLKEGHKVIAEYFRKLRFDPKFHLGLGDIRLTIGQQREIVDLVSIMSNRLCEVDKLDWLEDGEDKDEKIVVSMDIDGKEFKTAAAKIADAVRIKAAKRQSSNPKLYREEPEYTKVFIHDKDEIVHYIDKSFLSTNSTLCEIRCHPISTIHTRKLPVTCSACLGLSTGKYSKSMSGLDCGVYSPLRGCRCWVCQSIK